MNGQRLESRLQALEERGQNHCSTRYADASDWRDEPNTLTPTRGVKLFEQSSLFRPTFTSLFGRLLECY